MSDESSAWLTITPQAARGADPPPQRKVDIYVDRVPRERRTTKFS